MVHVLDSKNKLFFQNILYLCCQVQLVSSPKQQKQNITKQQSYFLFTSTFDVSIFTCLQQIYFSTFSKTKCSLLHVKTNNCPCSCREARREVGTIDLQVTYDTDHITTLRKANVLLFHDNRNTQVRSLRASHVASGNPSPYKIVGDTYDWHANRSFVLRCTLNHFNTIFNATINHGSQNPHARSANT